MTTAGGAGVRRGEFPARPVLLVFAGGVIGTAARESIVLAMPGDTLSWGVLTVNLGGSLLIGFLVGALGRRPESPRARDLRLFAGTGVLGGFTTYSALAVDAARLLESAPGIAVAYSLGSVVGGLALAALGVMLGGRGGPRHPSSLTDGRS